MNQDISRRLFTAGLVLAPTLAKAQGNSPALSASDQAYVDKAVAYLQGLTRLRGRFTQTDARGARATGDFYLQRPGKVRFQYDPPQKLLMISDGNQFAVQDDRLGTFARYPLATTPLALFLAREIRLDRGVRITSVTRQGSAFSITARDSGRQTPGQLVLNFGDSPVALRGWTTTDAQGQSIQVQLSNLQTVSTLDPALFRFTVPNSGGSRRPG